MEILEALEIKNKYKKEWQELEDYGDLRYSQQQGLESLLETAKETLEAHKKEIERIEEALASGCLKQTAAVKKQLKQFKAVINAK